MYLAPVACLLQKSNYSFILFISQFDENNPIDVDVIILNYCGSGYIEIKQKFY